MLPKLTPRYDIMCSTRMVTRVCMAEQTAQLLRGALELLLKEAKAVVGDSVPDEYRVVVELVDSLPRWKRGKVKTE